MNRLQHVDDFRTVLTNYQLSDSAKRTLDQTRLVLLIGPTSSGRNTIINELVRGGGYHYIVSDTTRQPRMKDGVAIEQNGREYWFRDEAELLQDIQSGEFLEAAIIHDQQVSGISIREIKAAQEANQIAITDIEPTGAATICKLKPNAILIFIVPPNFTTWMERLHSRSDLPADEIRRRLLTACEEIKIALGDSDYTFVVNDDFIHAAQAIRVIAEQHTVSEDQQQAARMIAEDLLKQTEQYLSGKA